MLELHRLQYVGQHSNQQASDTHLPVQTAGHEQGTAQHVKPVASLTELDVGKQAHSMSFSYISNSKCMLEQVGEVLDKIICSWDKLSPDLHKHLN